MSNPLKRRMAKAALLLAAGAAPVIGSAGAASAVSLPSTTDLGGLSTVDAASLGDAVDGAAQTTTKLAGEAGAEVVSEAVPAGGQAAGEITKKAAPTVQDTAGTVTESAGSLVGTTMAATAETGVPGNMPTSEMPVNLLG